MAFSKSGEVEAVAADWDEGCEGGDCAEQPRQITRRAKNARRSNMQKTRLNINNLVDYLTPQRFAGWAGRLAASRYRETSAAAAQ
jgi:hypothetical protein